MIDLPPLFWLSSPPVVAMTNARIPLLKSSKASSHLSSLESLFELLSSFSTGPSGVSSVQILEDRALMNT
jgi:hypothetical protein